MQHEMFEPPKLMVSPVAGAREPRLWVRRLVIWSEPAAKPTQDIAFAPGLNIIWSPDPVDHSARDGDEVPSGPGHGAGKTLVCRLLRYCLGEPQFASDVLRGKISGAFKDGRVGAEVVVDGKVWVIVRSIGVLGHDVVVENGTLETAANPDATPTGMASFVELLAERFVTPDVAGLIADSPQRAWLLALAWLTRDQECHFGKFAEWRAPGVMSGSPARGLSVSNATHVVRALIGAVTPREHELDTEIERLDKERSDVASGVERRQWLVQDALKRILNVVQVDEQQVPDGDLRVLFLRGAIKDKVARVAIVDVNGELASVQSLEVKLEEARAEFDRIKDEIARTEGAASTASAVVKLIASETPGLSATIDDAKLPMCPVCEVPIDRALAEGCKLSHKLPDVASLQQRRERNTRELQRMQADERAAEVSLKRLRPELMAAAGRRDKAREDLRVARQLDAERSDAWYGARRVGDDVGNFEKLLSEQAAAEQKVVQLDEALKQRRKDAGAEREQHAVVFASLGAHFDPLVRRLLGRTTSASGRVQHDGNGLQLVVDFGGERNTPAIDLVKVLAFDLATLCRSMEGATHLPSLLVHDSPRTSDLGLSIYHELFHLMRELEGVGPAPLFQYIVTTTSRPPDDLVNDVRVRLKLHGSPAEARLLGRDL